MDVEKINRLLDDAAQEQDSLAQQQAEDDLVQPFVWVVINDDDGLHRAWWVCASKGKALELARPLGLVVEKWWIL